MLKRTLVAVLLLAIAIPCILWGGIPYYLLLGFFVVTAAWEYVNIFAAMGVQPARWLVIGSVLVLIVTRIYFPGVAAELLALAVLLLMAYHVLAYERGARSAGLDFSVSVGALVYMGWIGSYLFTVRQMQDGAWWVMFILPIAWMTDSGAYMIGKAYGKHQMAPRLSPKKTWEGFAAGAFTAALTGGFLAYAYSTWGPLHLPVWAGAGFGMLLGLLTPFGDLGESMFKREAGIKDSGNIIPGHGGTFDRIDSWLWAGVLGFYFVTWFVPLLGG